jgi:hypothetical protein
MKPPLVLLITLAFGLAIGCTSGPQGATRKAAALWAEAKQSYRIGDLQKTDNTLLEISNTENTFAADARVWQLVVSAGLTQGFSGLADAYESGSRHDVTNPLRFHNQAVSLRSFAANAALEFAQGVHNMVGNDQGLNVKLAFAFPPGSPVPPEALLKISSGLWPRDSDRELVETAMLQRGVLLAVSAAVGSPEDPAAAQAAFQTAEVRVPRQTFMVGMAKLLYDESELFGPQRMDRLERFVLMCREASEALRSIPQSDDTKELAIKIEDTLKKNGGI